MEKNATRTSYKNTNVQKLKTTFQEAPIGFAIVDLELRFTKVNKLFQQMLGYSESELKNRYVDDFLHLDDINLLNGSGNSPEGNLSFESEKRFINRNGDVVWGNTNIKLIRNDARMPLCWSITIIDITRQKQAIRDQQITEKKLKAIYAALPDLFLITDTGGKVLEIKSKSVKGKYFADEVSINKSLLNIKPPHIASRFYKAMEQVNQNKQLHVVHYHAQFGEHIKHFEARLQPYSPGKILIIIRDVSLLKKSEKLLKDSQARWRSLVNYSNEIVINLDLKGNILAINKTPLEFGNQNLQGKNLIQLVEESTGKTIETALRDVVKLKKPIAFESGAKDAATGTPIHYLSSISPVIQDNEVKAVTLLSRDISSLKTTLTKLDENNHFTQKIANTVPDTIFISDLVAHRNLYYNREPWFLLDYTREEWVKNYANITHPEDRQKIQEARTKLALAKDDETITTEYRLKHKNGKWRWFKSRNQVFRRFPDGSVHQIMGIVEDITDWVKQQNALKIIAESVSVNSGEEFFNRLVYSLADCLEMECAFLGQVDRNTDEMTTFAYCEMGKIVPNVTFDIRKTPCEKLFEKSCHIFPEKVQTLFPFDDYLKYSNIESYACVTLYDNAGKELGILAVMGQSPIKNLKLTESLLTIFASRASYELDRISKEKKLATHLGEIKHKNRQLQKYINSNLELEKFAYVASHDLKEPLRNIVSFSQLLKQRFYNELNVEAQEYINFIVEGTKRMENLINDLLDYSRVNTASKKLSKVDTAYVVEKIMVTLRNTIKKYNVDISYTSLPTIVGNELLVTQLFQNLITNAIKFSRVKSVNPVIKIKARKKNGFYEFAITDNGIGIEQEYYDQIFLLFKTLHSQGEFTGTGIGLAICKKIVDKHKGEIWVKSEVGKGSTFYFSFPCIKVHKPALEMV